MRCRVVCVLFSTCVSSSSKKRLTKAVEDLGGTVAASHEDAFTHFLASKFVRSLSALVALAAGASALALTRLAQDSAEASGRMHVLCHQPGLRTQPHCLTLGPVPHCLAAEHVQRIARLRSVAELAGQEQSSWQLAACVPACAAD